ncbi:Apoptosis-antagonizing transcription factor domain protein [Theileria parva strain Muguga]|uniref:Apoptosis-antagonizing transcription factor domain protein n=1 Tax=Theileria parva strain Muguga TaxID=333668 RepID=UPI001C61E664|nr:Apoptosis-antagonizing transcription factor domain protein [Theileria parva strain Muguga]KAF5153141.1 Apoptosis-antagonizing transcription factor domain protein [Theileria parva strain Muguga]
MKTKLNKKNGIVKRQLIEYNNLLKIRVYLQKINSCIQRWPHPLLSNLIAENLQSHEIQQLNQIKANLLQILKIFFSKLSKPSLIRFKPDVFGDFDYLLRRRTYLLERLDYLNDISNFNVNRSFNVIDNNISSHIKFFHQNPEKFINKSHILNLPQNLVGFEFLSTKCGFEESKRLHIAQIYNDQVFYVKLLNYLIQNDENSEIDLKNEESLIKNNQHNKLRLSLNKTAKDKKIRYTLIEKLQNFVERTNNKSFNSPEFTNLLINSLFNQLN